MLAWLVAHRTRLGSLPEQVNAAGQPASVAPLAWTDAVTLLALLAQAGHLATIPVPPANKPSADLSRGERMGVARALSCPPPLMVISPVQTSMPSTSPAKARPSRLVTTAKSPKNQRSGQTTQMLIVSSPAAVWLAVRLLAMLCGTVFVMPST